MNCSIKSPAVGKIPPAKLAVWVTPPDITKFTIIQPRMLRLHQNFQKHEHVVIQSLWTCLEHTHYIYIYIIHTTWIDHTK